MSQVKNTNVKGRKYFLILVFASLSYSSRAQPISEAIGKDTNSNYSYCVNSNTATFLQVENDTLKKVFFGINSADIKNSHGDISNLVVISLNSFPHWTSLILTSEQPYPYGSRIRWNSMGSISFNSQPDISFVLEKQNLFSSGVDSVALYINYYNFQIQKLVATSAPFVIYRFRNNDFWSGFGFKIKCESVHDKLTPQQRIYKACLDKEIYPSKDACELLFALNPEIKKRQYVSDKYPIKYPNLPRMSRIQKYKAKIKYKELCRNDSITNQEYLNEFDQLEEVYYKIKTNLNGNAVFKQTIDETEVTIKNLKQIKPVVSKTSRLVVQELTERLILLRFNLNALQLGTDNGDSINDLINIVLPEINGHLKNIAHAFKIKLSELIAIVDFKKDDLFFASSEYLYVPDNPGKNSNVSSSDEEFSIWNLFGRDNKYPSKKLVGRTCKFLVWRCPNENNCTDDKRPLDQNILKDISLRNRFKIYYNSPAFLCNKRDAIPADSIANTSTANLTAGEKKLWATDIYGKGVSDTTTLEGAQISSKYFYIKIKE